MIPMMTLDRKQGEKMLDFVDVKFEPNKYYLMAELLTSLPNINQIFSKKISINNLKLKSIPSNEKKALKEDFKEFCEIADKIPEIKDLINFDINFELLKNNREEQINYNKYMNEKIESFSNIDTIDQLKNSNNQKYANAFQKLFNTKFFKYAYNKSIEHAEEMKKEFDKTTKPVNEEMKQIIGKPKTKQVSFIALPPQLFFKTPHYLPNSEKDENYKGVASFSPIFDKLGKNLKDVILLHEITHTEIPLPDKSKFSNDVQFDIYSRINHSLVELTNDCEMGMKICGFKNYFKTPMHNEFVLDKEGSKVNIDELQKYGIGTNENLDFECKTKKFGKTTITEKNEIGNDKIRGVIYPYFLMYKNRTKENPMESTLSEIARDSKIIKKIYGQEFLENIKSEGNITKVYEAVKDSESLQELNDVIAEKVFDIEKQKIIESTTDSPKLSPENYHSKISYFHDQKSDLYFTEQKIGKATVNIPTKNKDKAHDKVLNKVHERTHPDEIHEHTMGHQNEM